MKKSLSFWQFAGFVFTGIMGTLLHFLYNWTDTTVVALFSAVNESIWEHMKILFFPLFFFALFESRYLAKEYPNFWASKLIGIMAALMLIPTSYYTYTGALGVKADWFNILIFFIAAAVSFIIETRIMKNQKGICISAVAAIIILCAVAVLFFIFTFAPPEIPLFQDPLTKTYGLT